MPGLQSHTVVDAGDAGIEVVVAGIEVVVGGEEVVEVEPPACDDELKHALIVTQATIATAAIRHRPWRPTFAAWFATAIPSHDTRPKHRFYIGASVLACRMP